MAVGTPERDLFDKIAARTAEKETVAAIYNLHRRLPMYKHDQKALLMTKDRKLGEKMESYLFHRYNLRTELAEDIIEVFNRLGADDSPDSTWNLVIFDETVAGLQPTSHALKTLKSRYSHLNILYLSTVLEVAEPYCRTQMEELPLPEYADENYRIEQINMQLDKVIGVLTPVTKAESLAELYQTIPRIMVKKYNADWALCSVLRLDETPVQGGVVTSDFPGVLEIPTEFPLKGTGYLDEMVTYFKPVHVPDLDKNKAFRRELEKKFSRRFRSAVLIPMQYDGNGIGFIGMFTRRESRLYRLPDLDLLQRLADMSTVAVITHFYREHGNLDIDRIREEIRRSETGLGGEMFPPGLKRKK